MKKTAASLLDKIKNEITNRCNNIDKILKNGSVVFGILEDEQKIKIKERKAVYQEVLEMINGEQPL